MDDLARFCCQNPDCTLYTRRDAGNLSVRARYGKQDHIRLLYCNACKYRFSERKGTALFHSHLPEEKALAVFRHLDEGCGIRATGRLVGVDQNTVGRLARIAGRHAHDAHDELVASSPRTREVQLDEKHAFVAKKQKNCDPTDPGDDHKGDYWDHIALDAEHRLVLAVVPGARTMENAEALVTAVKQRLGDEPPRLITSDELPAYTTAIEDVFGTPVEPGPTPRPGPRPILPERRVPEGLVYATVHKERERNRVVAVRQVLVLGGRERLAGALEESTASCTINTSFIERHHGTDRGRNARKARKTYKFSKDWRVHEAMTYFTLYSYNFCWAVRTLRARRGDGSWRHRTPAMAAGLAQHVWSLREWLTFPAVPAVQ